MKRTPPNGGARFTVESQWATRAAARVPHQQRPRRLVKDLNECFANSFECVPTALDVAAGRPSSLR